MSNKLTSTLRNRLRLRIHCWYEKDLTLLPPDEVDSKLAAQFGFQVVPSRALAQYKASVPATYHAMVDRMASVTDHDAAILTTPGNELACYQTFSYNGPFNREMNLQISLKPGEVYFSTLRTFEAFSGKGLASACLRALEHYLIGEGKARGIIITKKQNRAARRVFTKLGWAHRRTYYVLRIGKRYFRIFQRTIQQAA